MDLGMIGTIIAALLAVSEGIAIIPGMRSNSIFQLIYFILKAIVKGIQTKEV